MELDKNQIIQNGIEAKKQRFEIRKELIGLSHDTSDFDAVYTNTLSRLGLQEPLPPKVTVGAKTYIPPEFGGTGTKLPHINNGVSYTKVGLFIFVVIMLIAMLFVYGAKFVTKTNPNADEQLKWGKESMQDKEGVNELNFNDDVLQTKVKATVASAMIQGGRMGSYDGVCRDISVVAPVACKETEKSFMIYAPMSNGTYFCEDKKQQGSIVPSSPIERMQCR